MRKATFRIDAFLTVKRKTMRGWDWIHKAHTHTHTQNKTVLLCAILEKKQRKNEWLHFFTVPFDICIFFLLLSREVGNKKKGNELDTKKK